MRAREDMNMRISIVSDISLSKEETGYEAVKGRDIIQNRQGENRILMGVTEYGS